jgi:deoxycytidylate deaminase
MSTKKGIMLAMKQAQKSKHHKQLVGCVIIKGGSVISRGFNKIKFHSSTTTRGRCAEIDAVIRCRSSNINNAKMYVVRVTPGGKIGLAKPCIPCQNFLRGLGIKKIFFTTNDGTIGSMKLDKQEK